MELVGRMTTSGNWLLSREARVVGCSYRPSGPIEVDNPVAGDPHFLEVVAGVSGASERSSDCIRIDWRLLKHFRRLAADEILTVLALSAIGGGALSWGVPVKLPSGAAAASDFGIEGRTLSSGLRKLTQRGLLRESTRREFGRLIRTVELDSEHSSD